MSPPNESPLAGEPGEGEEREPKNTAKVATPPYSVKPHEVMTEEEREEYEKINAALRALPRERKIDMYDELFKNTEFKYIRDFVLVRGIGPIFTTVILHFPTGEWRGTGRTYEESLDRLKTHPEEDKAVIRWIYHCS